MYRLTAKTKLNSTVELVNARIVPITKFLDKYAGDFSSVQLEKYNDSTQRFELADIRKVQ